MPVLELQLLLPDGELLVAHLVPRNAPHQLEPLLDEALVVRAEVLDVLLERFALAAQLLLDLDAARLQILDLDLDLLLLALNLLRDSQSEGVKT